MPDDVSRITIRSHEDAEEAKSLARQYARLNPGDAPAAPPSFSSTGQSVGQVQSITFGAGQNTTPGFMRMTTSEVAPRDEAAGILSTARSNKSGGPVSGRGITRESIVVVHGMETTVAAAAAMGLLKVNPNTGMYEETNPQGSTPSATVPAANNGGEPQSQDGQQPTNQQSADEGQIPPFSDDLEAHISDFQKVGNMDFEAGMSDMITTGEMSDNTATNIAGQLGIPPEEVRSRAGALREAFEAQAMEMTGTGEFLRDILQTMQQKNPEAVNKAVRDHVEQGRTDAYNKVIGDFIYDLSQTHPRELLENPEAKKLGARLEKDGEISLAIPGFGRIGWRAAITAGIISPTWKK